MRQQRDELPLTEKAVLDKGLCAKLLKIIEERKARVIHAYLPFGSEIDICPLIEQLLAGGYTIVCPKSLPKRALQNLILKSLQELEDGRYGTKHPANSEEYAGKIDLFIVPGVAFSRDNYRLGYGSGYYDQFFSTHPEGYKLGVCYPFQIVDHLPTEPHDISLDAVLF